MTSLRSTNGRLSLITKRFKIQHFKRIYFIWMRNQLQNYTPQRAANTRMEVSGTISNPGGYAVFHQYLLLHLKENCKVMIYLVRNSDREWNIMLMCHHTNKKENQDTNHWGLLIISLNVSPCERYYPLDFVTFANFILSN